MLESTTSTVAELEGNKTHEREAPQDMAYTIKDKSFATPRESSRVLARRRKISSHVAVIKNSLTMSSRGASRLVGDDSQRLATTREDS